MLKDNRDNMYKQALLDNVIPGETHLVMCIIGGAKLAYDVVKKYTCIENPGSHSSLVMFPAIGFLSLKKSCKFPVCFSVVPVHEGGHTEEKRSSFDCDQSCSANAVQSGRPDLITRGRPTRSWWDQKPLASNLKEKDVCWVCVLGGCLPPN